MWSEGTIFTPYSSNRLDPSSKRLIVAAILSFLLHLLLSAFFSSLASLKAHESPVNRVKVSLRPIERAVIVPPSDIKESTEVPETKNLSDKNTVVKQESIKRGEMGSPPPKPASKQSAPAAPKPVAEPKKQVTTPKLFLDKDFVVPSNQKPASAERKKSDLREHVMNSMEPFRKNQQSVPALGIGSSGVPDLVTGVSEGAVTLLNAKADQYAIFVRRVALQVFGALKKTSWAELSFQGIQQIKSLATVEGIMSPDGKFIDARLIQRSGSDSFDTILLGAVKKSLWDQNPSKGAIASDGNYHFIFQSRTWARPAPRGGDERWLLLGTGLL